jgi:NMD protein affecting ribosome stability and mRNA decay
MSKKLSFKKTCISCGQKVEKVHEGMCENCIKEHIPPIKEVKELNFKVCNATGKILFNNFYYKVEEIEKMLPGIMKKQVTINEPYILKELSIEDFEVEGHKLGFDLVVECKLKD